MTRIYPSGHAHVSGTTAIEEQAPPPPCPLLRFVDRPQIDVPAICLQIQGQGPPR